MSCTLHLMSLSTWLRSNVHILCGARVCRCLQHSAMRTSNASNNDNIASRRPCLFGECLLSEAIRDRDLRRGLFHGAFKMSVFVQRNMANGTTVTQTQLAITYFWKPPPTQVPKGSEQTYVQNGGWLRSHVEAPTCETLSYYWLLLLCLLVYA